MRPVVRALRGGAPLWQGKTFFADSTGVNHVLGGRAVRMGVEATLSQLDGAATTSFRYDLPQHGNPWPVRNMVDEVRMVGSDMALGPAFFSASARRAAPRAVLVRVARAKAERHGARLSGAGRGREERRFRLAPRPRRPERSDTLCAALRRASRAPRGSRSDRHWQAPQRRHGGAGSGGGRSRSGGNGRRGRRGRGELLGLREPLSFKKNCSASAGRALLGGRGGGRRRSRTFADRLARGDASFGVVEAFSAASSALMAVLSVSSAASSWARMAATLDWTVNGAARMRRGRARRSGLRRRARSRRRSPLERRLSGRRGLVCAVELREHVEVADDVFELDLGGVEDGARDRGGVVLVFGGARLGDEDGVSGGHLVGELFVQGPVSGPSSAGMVSKAMADTSSLRSVVRNRTRRPTGVIIAPPIALQEARSTNSASEPIPHRTANPP